MMKDTISEQSLQRLELYNCIGLLLSFYSDFHITRIGMWISEVFLYFVHVSSKFYYLGPKMYTNYHYIVRLNICWA